MIIATLLTITFILVCVKMRKSHKYWKNKKVLHIRPWPFFGLVAPTIVGYKAYPWVLQNAYNVFPEQRFFGLYQLLTPYLLIRNTDLIETIAIKDFENFSCRKTKIDAESDPVYARILFSMKGGERWQKLRGILHVALSSGELTNTFRSMQECTKNFLSQFLKDSLTRVELKDLTAKFANDVIAATVFGYTCNSLENPDNDFYSMTKYITGFNFLRTIKFFLYGLSPRFMKFFKFSLVDNRTRQFYQGLIKDNPQSEYNRGLLHFFKTLCSEAHNKDGDLENNSEVTSFGKTKITEDDILAQAIQFLLFGFKTVSTCLLFLLYELSNNVKIQEKLFNDIDNISKNLDEDVSYESLMNMEYLDMVVAETLRKWPPTVTTNRKADKPFTIEAIKNWEETRSFDAGTLCLIPIFAIHRDSTYFSNPDVFDPERFNSQNRNLIKPFTYIPFGVGPRNCIGSEFALVQMKLFLFCLLSRFKVVKIDKSQELIKLRKNVLQLVPAERVWVGLETRAKEV